MNDTAKEGLEILIVEDSPTQAEQLKYVLENNGYRAVSARSGGEALAYLAARLPALVISDIVMPGMDGFELCRKIKSDTRLRRLPVILLTTLTEPEDILRGLECGADSYIHKPYEEEVLLSRINYVVMNLEALREPTTEPGLEITVAGKKQIITSGRIQMFGMLLSAYETVVRDGRNLKKAFEAQSLMMKELGELQKELAARYNKLKESEEARLQFTYMLAHDLRNPVVSIQGFSRLILEGDAGPVTAQQKEMLATIAFSAEKQSRLIDEILAAAKADSRHMDIEKKETDLAKIVDETLKEMEGAASYGGVSLAAKISARPLLAKADHFRIWQVLVNIISNSLKFSLRNDAVSVSAEKVRAADVIIPGHVDSAGVKTLRGEYILLSVQDQGTGIPAEALSLVFERYLQAGSAEHRRKGSGLGLFVAKHIVEMHDGLIWAESEGPGKGTTIKFLIPASGDADY